MSQDTDNSYTITRTNPALKFYHASPGFGDALTEQQTLEFLCGPPLNLQLGTIDEQGDPNVHTVWYIYKDGHIFIDASKYSKKVRNIRTNARIYFCIDDEKLPYRGVRGKGDAVIHKDISFTLPIAESIMLKYTGSLDNEIAAALLDGVKNAQSILIEITPIYYSTWDHGSGVTGGRDKSLP